MSFLFLSNEDSLTLQKDFVLHTTSDVILFFHKKKGVNVKLKSKIANFATFIF